MRTPVATETPEGASRRKRRLLLITIAVSVVVVGSVVAYLLLQPGPPLDLLGVSLSPNPATPDQPITVTAQVQGGTFLAQVSVLLQYTAFFTGGPSGGSTMFHKGGETYATTIGPFANGTAVWLVVTASDGHGFQLASNLTAEVGTISSGGASGLRINSVVLEPPHPTSLDDPTLTVNVTSSAAVTGVYLSTIYFYSTARSTASGGGGGQMMLNAEGNYTSFPGMLFGMGPSPYGTTVGTIWLYRVGAQDSAGHAVLSPVYTFSVALPPL